MWLTVLLQTISQSYTTLPSEVNLRYRAVFPITMKRALSERIKLPVELVFKKLFVTLRIEL